MLLLLSPAKTLDYDTPVPATVARRATEPMFTPQAAELIQLLRPKAAGEVAALMALSDALATLNVQRYGAWQPAHTPLNSKPALLAFAGDVYDGLQAGTLRAADLDWAQRHVLILSGLYGLLRPLDRLQPYRLEMGTALANPRGRDLYAWWGDRIADEINQRLHGERSRVVLNLASQEYARAALRPALQAPVIDCVFEDWKDGQYKLISFFAKRARGLMARHVIDRRLRGPAGLKDFNSDGYAYAPAVSAPDRLVFRRRV
jgi:cytoplasmic iron level regulating protein YaaA (DUF328/UPF0246 family)